MNNDSSVTDDNGMPPIPTFNYPQKGQVEPTNSDSDGDKGDRGKESHGSDQSTDNTDSPSNPKNSGNKNSRKKKTAIDTSTQAVSPPVNFSTDLRRSIQADIAIISYNQGKTIKQILDEALTLWLASPDMSDQQKQKKLKLMQFPEQDPIDSFSNRISSELKRQLAKLKFDREGINHPVKTIAAFTEEALINWIPLQPEFSVEERTKRLLQKAA